MTKSDFWLSIYSVISYNDHFHLLLEIYETSVNIILTSVNRIMDITLCCCFISFDNNEKYFVSLFFLERESVWWLGN